MKGESREENEGNIRFDDAESLGSIHFLLRQHKHFIPDTENVQPVQELWIRFVAKFNRHTNARRRTDDFG